MLKIHFLQHWFNLSDPAVEEALYDSRAMRRFVGIDLGREPAADETTICKFRHLLEAHNLSAELFRLINEYLAENRLTVKTRHDRRCHPDRCAEFDQEPGRPARSGDAPDEKGNQWYFGMKAHVGVDSQSKLIHSVTATSANVHDSRMLPDLLHGQETRVWGDSVYAGQTEVIRRLAPYAQDFTHHKGHRRQPLSAEERARNRIKSRVRAKGEHPFLILKRIFGFTKVRYRGMHKNANRLFVACGLVNLYMNRRLLLRAT
ncbi:MAG: IS5 family transposase [Gammaproteobacteria bacterium]